MSKEIKNKIVPVRRFPEFKDEGWAVKSLGEIGAFTGGGTPSKNNESFWTGNIPWISSSDIDEDSINQIKISRFITDEALEDSATKRVPPNSILLVSRVGVGKLAITNEFICTSQDFTNFTPKQDNLVFLAYLLKCQKETLLGFSQGMAIKGFTKDDISKLKISIPSYQEQQKIADCLSSLDELLTAENQKMHALKKYKKGMMQELFPAEGETVPKLRFKEFKDSWEESKLESLIDLLSGYAFQSEYFSNIGMKLLIPKNFTKDGKANFNHENTKYTTENFDPKYICKEGDLMLLITDLTPSCELLGKPLLLTKEDGDVLLNQRIIRVIPKSSIERRFLLYFFSTEIYHKRIKDTATGSTVRHSSNSIIAETQIYVPSTKEQIKIANLLSSLDETISTQTEKIETLKIHKKGLMQSLFPNTTIKR